MSAENTHPRAAGHISSRFGKEARPRVDLYQEITQRVIGMLNLGVAPWRSCILGQQAVGFPRNLLNGKQYRGINVFILAFTAYNLGYESAYWLTFQPAQQRGGSIKKGEKSSAIVFWKQHEVIDRETGEVKQTPLLRNYNVFNLSQCKGIPAPDAPQFKPSDFKQIERAEAVVQGYKGKPEIVTGGKKAFYTPSTDTVKIPEPTRFESTEQFHATLFHELAHSTGHSKRLDRKLDTKLAPFGSPDYGREELVAEMAAAFLCAEARIEPATIQNQAAYLKGWLGALKADKRLIISAGGAAQRAADWILDGDRGNGPESHAASEPADVTH